MESDRGKYLGSFLSYSMPILCLIYSSTPFLRAREVYVMSGKDDGGNTSTKEKEYISDSDGPPSLLGTEEELPSKGKGKKVIRADVAKSRPAAAKIVNPKAPKVKIELEDAAWSESDKEADPIGTQCRLPDTSLLNLYVL
jgi:hypothetical protein